MTCHRDSETGEYVGSDGDTCRKDEYGFPTRHCTARRTCANHVGLDDLTCARCIHRTRTDLRTIVVRYAELMPEAIVAGVDSEAAALVGPATDPEAWMWRQTATRGRLYEVHWNDDDALMTALAGLPEDDERHPVTLLGRWCLMLAEDYGLEVPVSLDLTRSAGMLDRLLTRVAQDSQDWPLLARELRKCRSHLESVLRDSQTPERGAPCPECRDAGQVVRMVREYPHHCEDKACERVHYETDEADVWVCPRNRDHWRSHEDYLRWVEERTSA